jgi:hypothetical protein
LNVLKKVLGLNARPLKRRFLYSRLDKEVGGSEFLAGEPLEVKSWRDRIYGAATAAEETHRVVRPLFVERPVDLQLEQSRIMRRFGVDVELHIESDLPVVRDNTTVFSAFNSQKSEEKKVALVPREIPQKGKQRTQMEALLKQNAVLLTRLKLLKTWFTETDLKASQDYAAIVEEIERNFCTLLS